MLKFQSKHTKGKGMLYRVTSIPVVLPTRCVNHSARTELAVFYCRNKRECAYKRHLPCYFRLPPTYERSRVDYLLVSVILPHFSISFCAQKTVTQGNEQR
jgi:hypothetical protein